MAWMIRTWIRLPRLRRASAQSVPAGIYGTVICASILASAGDQPSAQVALVVLVTLFVYWLAERYAEVLGLAGPPDDEGSPAEPGHAARITASHVRHVLRSGWSMIEASITPLLVLLGSRLLGANAETAVNIALAYTVFLLIALGRLAATRAGLTGWSRLAATMFAAVLGLIVIALKTSLH
jgi:hypothetical protein